MTSFIRPALPRDYDAILPLAGEVHAQHAAALPTVFRTDACALPRAYFDELLANDTATIYVAEVGDAIVGFAIFTVFEAPPYEILVPRRIAFVESIVVTLAHRGKGIGRGLMQAAIAWGRARGAHSLELAVWEFNREAIAFYEHLGLASVQRTMGLDL